MIGRLRGILLEKQPPNLLIDVNGVGYELSAPMSSFYQLPEIGREVILHTHLIIREDAHLLFGFYQLRERALFRELIKVNGVGPKLALAILSSMEANAFVQCIMNHDSTSLVRVPGVGKKTAERLVIEMHDRLKDWEATGEVILNDLIEQPKLAPAKQALQDALSALVALGYKPQEASRAINRVPMEGLSSEQIIRKALQEMVS